MVLISVNQQSISLLYVLYNAEFVMYWQIKQSHCQ